MRSVFLVAEFEFLQTAKRWQFLAVTLALPLFLAFLMWVSVKSGSHANSTLEEALDEGRKILIAAPQNSLQLQSTDVFEPVSGCADYAALLIDQTHFACVELEKDYMKTGVVRMLAPSQRVLGVSRSVVPILSDYLQKKMIADLSEDRQERIFTPVVPQIEVVKPDYGIEQYDYHRLVVPVLFLVVFILSVSTASTFLLQSVSEEKENRTMEMILSMVQDTHLIAGKALGLGAAALLQVGVWCGMGLLLMPYMARLLQIPLSLGEVPLSHFGLALVVLVLGFVQFAALMIGTGALGANFKDSQQLSSFFLIGSVLPIYMIQMVLSDVNGLIARVLYYFPLTSPVVVVFRYCVTDLSTIEVVLGLLALGISAIAGVVLAVRMFRIGSLTYNRRPSFREVRLALFSR